MNIYRTSVPNIYAVGDVIGRPSLAATAMEQGRQAICHALDIDVSYEDHYMPVGIYSIPELASVGLSEAAARAEYGDIIIGKAKMEDVVRAQNLGCHVRHAKINCSPRRGRSYSVFISLVKAPLISYTQGNWPY